MVNRVKGRFYFPVWPRNRLISAGLEPAPSHTKKSCIALNYRQFTININIKIIKLVSVLLALAFCPSGLEKLLLILEFMILISAESCL